MAQVRLSYDQGSRAYIIRTENRSDIVLARPGRQRGQVGERVITGNPEERSQWE